MRVLDLFSGIGGFSLGLERAGMQTVAFCEYEEFPRKVLAKHWPKVPCYPDVRELTKEKLDADGIGTIDLICGGFPCQPFSLAGKRRGAADDRSLWPEMFRLIRSVRPRWVLGENVVGIISMELDQVLFDLEGVGYSCWAFVIPACAVDAQHIRERVWILANANSDRPQGLTKPSFGAGKGVAQQGKAAARGFERDLSGGNKVESEPGVCRASYGVPDRAHRLKALGNAVVPGVVEVIGRAIMECES